MRDLYSIEAWVRVLCYSGDGTNLEILWYVDANVIVSVIKTCSLKVED